MPQSSLKTAPLFRRIVVGIDLGEDSEDVLRVAFAVARRFGAPVYVLHVFEPASRPVVSLVRPRPMVRSDALRGRALRERRVATAQKILVQQTRKALGMALRPSIRTVVVPGNAAEMVVRCAGDVEADLIVVGSGSGASPIGSVAQRVLRMAPVPVLLVPSERSRDRKPSAARAPAKLRALPRRKRRVRRAA